MSGHEFEIVAYDPRNDEERRLTLRADSRRDVVRLVEERGLEVRDLRPRGFRRVSGESVPWINLVAIVGVLVTALASVAMGFVENPGPNPNAPRPAANPRAGR